MPTPLELAQVAKKISYTTTGGQKVGIGTTVDIAGNLSVSEQSFFTGIGTFESDLFIGGILYAPSLDVSGSVSLGDDLSTRNIYATGIATIAGDLFVLGDLTYEDVVNVDSIGIATARSGLRVTGGGLNVTGVSTFQNNLELESTLTDFYGNVGAATSVLIGDASGVKWEEISTAALQGVQGLQGRQGIQGLQGLQGYAGTQGVDGIDGTQGTTGSQGTQGRQGIQGLQGLQGTIGLQGTGAPESLTVLTKSSAYTLILSDAGKLITISSGGVTVPASVFSAGQSVLIYNNSSSSQTITQGSSVTLRLPGTSDTGNRTLQQRGLATVLCVASNEFIITGSGLL